MNIQEMIKEASKAQEIKVRIVAATLQKVGTFDPGDGKGPVKYCQIEAGGVVLKAGATDDLHAKMSLRKPGDVLEEVTGVLELRPGKDGAVYPRIQLLGWK